MYINAPTKNRNASFFRRAARFLARGAIFYLFIYFCLLNTFSQFLFSFLFFIFHFSVLFFCRLAVTDTLCTHVRGRTSSPAPPGVERPSRLSVTRCFLRASRCVKCENDQGGRRRGSTIRNKNHHTGPAVR